MSKRLKCGTETFQIPFATFTVVEVTINSYFDLKVDNMMEKNVIFQQRNQKYEIEKESVLPSAKLLISECS